MKIERDERRFDFHDIGLAIKRAREASGMTQEQLAYIVDRSPRTIMYNENDGQHPSLNTFYQLVTMFDISVDQYFYPSKNTESSCRKRINAMLNSLDEKDLQVVEATIQALVYKRKQQNRCYGIRGRCLHRLWTNGYCRQRRRRRFAPISAEGAGRPFRLLLP